MGTIVCQSCDQIIEHFESEKSGVLYGLCHCCLDKNFSANTNAKRTPSD